MGTKWELDLWYEMWERASSQRLDTWYEMRGRLKDDPELRSDLGPTVDVLYGMSGAPSKAAGGREGE
jgi:hypothetical protein